MERGIEDLECKMKRENAADCAVSEQMIGSFVCEFIVNFIVYNA